MSVTTEDVEAIYPASSNAPIATFVSIAENIATTLLSNKGLSTKTMDTVVLYLTAHLLVLTYENGGLRRERMGDSDDSYVTPDISAKGFASTRFGQMAMILDTTGTLAASTTNAGLKARFEIVDIPDVLRTQV
jgi:hypothetical protein